MSISSLLKSDEKVYVFCRNNQIAKLFLKRAEEEGFLFGDGVLVDYGRFMCGGDYVIQG